MLLLDHREQLLLLVQEPLLLHLLLLDHLQEDRVVQHLRPAGFCGGENAHSEPAPSAQALGRVEGRGTQGAGAGSPRGSPRDALRSHGLTRA